MKWERSDYLPVEKMQALRKVKAKSCFMENPTKVIGLFFNLLNSCDFS